MHFITFTGMGVQIRSESSKWSNTNKEHVYTNYKLLSLNLFMILLRKDFPHCSECRTHGAIYDGLDLN